MIGTVDYAMPTEVAGLEWSLPSFYRVSMQWHPMSFQYQRPSLLLMGSIVVVAVVVVVVVVVWFTKTWTPIWIVPGFTGFFDDVNLEMFREQQPKKELSSTNDRIPRMEDTSRL